MYIYIYIIFWGSCLCDWRWVQVTAVSLHVSIRMSRLTPNIPQAQLGADACINAGTEADVPAAVKALCMSSFSSFLNISSWYFSSACINLSSVIWFRLEDSLAEESAASYARLLRGSISDLFMFLTISCMFLHLYCVSIIASCRSLSFFSSCLLFAYNDLVCYYIY